MPSIPLPNDPDLEHLKAQAKLVKQLLGEGDTGAIDMVSEFHPRFVGQTVSPADAAGLKLSDAQLMVARLYGFESWPKLRHHLEAVAASTRSPATPSEATNATLPTNTVLADTVLADTVLADTVLADTVLADTVLADDFLRLASHDYEGNPREREAAAQAFLAQHPDVAKASIFTMAVVGDAEGVAAAIAADPASATSEGGPNSWPPILHLCYSRIQPPGDANSLGWSAVDTLRVLLDAGADPNSGFLWRGNVPPFTALTGVIGGGERDESPHGDDLALARALLEAGADPNDGQALYNKARHHHDDTGYLELLLEFGLGTDHDGPWYQRFRSRLHSPAKLLVDELENAAKGKPARMWVLIDHGVNPDQPCGRSGKTPARIAAEALHFEVLDVLAAAELDVSLTPTEELCRHLLTADASQVPELGTDDRLADVLKAQKGLISRAALNGRLDLIEPLISIGFDINARFGANGITALHEAASSNDVAMAKALIEHGADPSITDAGIGAPPIGWAHYEGHTEVAAYLEALTPPT